MFVYSPWWWFRVSERLIFVSFEFWNFFDFFLFYSACNFPSFQFFYFEFSHQFRKWCYDGVGFLDMWLMWINSCSIIFWKASTQSNLRSRESAWWWALLSLNIFQRTSSECALFLYIRTLVIQDLRLISYGSRNRGGKFFGMTINPKWLLAKWNFLVLSKTVLPQIVLSRHFCCVWIDIHRIKE